MKGLVFTEFLEMVEQHHGFVFTEKLIDEADLPSGDAHTSVGTYDHAEMVKLLTLLSENDQRLKGFSNIYENCLIHKDSRGIWGLLSGTPGYNTEGEVMGSNG